MTKMTRHISTKSKLISSLSNVFSTQHLFALFFAAGACIITTGCSENIDWEVEDNQPRLVVQGMVTDEFKQHGVYLTTSQDLYNPGRGEGISGASLTLNDGETDYSLMESPQRQGYYITADSMAGVPGRPYTLSIQLSSPVGGHDHYEASTFMPAVLGFDSMRITKETILGEEDYVLKVFGKDVKAEDWNNYYLIHAYQNGELITGDFEEYILFDNEASDGDFEFNDFTIYRREDLMPGAQITLEVYSISEDYYTYLNNLIETSFGGDPLGLSGPPSNTFGNVSHEAFGYFFASPVTHTSAVIEE